MRTLSSLEASFWFLALTECGEHTRILFSVNLMLSSVELGETGRGSKSATDLGEGFVGDHDGAAGVGFQRVGGRQLVPRGCGLALRGGPEAPVLVAAGNVVRHQRFGVMKQQNSNQHIIGSDVELE